MLAVIRCGRRSALLFAILSVVALVALHTVDARAATQAYIANSFADTVKVVDPQTLTVIATITVAGRPVSVASTPATPYVFTANETGNSVSVINTATNAVSSTVGVGLSPEHVAVNSTGTRIYTANLNSNTVSVIDGTSFTNIATIPVNSRPAGVAVHPDNSRVYVVSQTGAGLFRGTVQVINAATNTVTATIDDTAFNFGGFAKRIVVTPDGSRAYVVAQDATVTVIDTSTNTTIAKVTLPGAVPGANITNIAMNPSGTRVYVSNQETKIVSIIDTSTNQFVGPGVLLTLAPADLAVTPDGSQVYVSQAADNSLSIIDTVSNNVSTPFPGTMPSPLGITFTSSSPTITSLNPTSILEFQTLDVTVNGTGFQPGATLDFGGGISVLSVAFVNSTQLIATIFAIPGFLTEGTSFTNQVTVTNRNGESFTTSPIFTVFLDSDGDGVPNATDNCGNKFNSNQAENPCAPVVEISGTTLIPETSPAPNQPVFLQVCATFPATGTPYFFAPPDDRTIHLQATVLGQPLDRRVPETVFLVIPDGLEFTDGTAPVERCYVTDLAQQFAFDPNSVVDVQIAYENRSHPIDPTALTFPLLQAELDLGTQQITTGPTAVAVVGGSVTVDPTVWSTGWAVTPTPDLATFTITSLTDGRSLSDVVLSSLVFEGTLAPASPPQLTAGGITMTVNKTLLLQALRKRIGHPFTDGEVERVLITGKLNDGSVLKTGVDITFQDSLAFGFAALIASVQGSSIDTPLKTLLLVRLTAARDVASTDPRRACVEMNQFILLVKSQSQATPKKIPTALANDWLAAASQITTQLGCK